MPLTFSPDLLGVQQKTLHQIAICANHSLLDRFDVMICVNMIFIEYALMSFRETRTPM